VAFEDLLVEIVIVELFRIEVSGLPSQLLLHSDVLQILQVFFGDVKLSLLVEYSDSNFILVLHDDRFIIDEFESQSNFGPDTFFDVFASVHIVKAFHLA
jgi:hypothetical protein